MYNYNLLKGNLIILKISVYANKNTGGKITAINSKSHFHRVLIAAALSNEKTIIKNIGNICEDVNRTIDCIKNFSYLDAKDDSIEIIGNNFDENTKIFNCGESGSTLRFLLPVVSALGLNGFFEAKDTLKKRPIREFMEVMSSHNAVYSSDNLPFSVKGKLNAGKYYTSGNISSQFISGLMFALPILNTDSEIILTTPLQSKSYVDLTRKVLRDFSVEINETNNGYYIKGNQKYVSPQKITVESDWSNIAFFLAAGAINGKITVTDVTNNSCQGDMAFIDILKKFGADIEIKNNTVTVSRNRLIGIETDISNIPDLAPIISIVGCFAEGETVIKNVDRLKYKESNRIEAICRNINAIGGKATYIDNSIRIVGGDILTGGNVYGYNDHRIVMAFAIASLCSKNPIIIDEAEAVKKSYPDFFDDFTKIGGSYKVTE